VLYSTFCPAWGASERAPGICTLNKADETSQRGAMSEISRRRIECTLKRWSDL
jgi:hypothetical protein